MKGGGKKQNNFIYHVIALQDDSSIKFRRLLTRLLLTGIIGITNSFWHAKKFEKKIEKLISSNDTKK